MTTSKALSIFAKRIDNDDALNNPQKYFEPNANKLLKFWSLLDTLTEEQWNTVNKRYYDFYINQGSGCHKAIDQADKNSKETIGEELANHAAHAAYDAAWDVYGPAAAYWATREIIGGVKNPVFLKMFDNLLTFHAYSDTIKARIFEALLKSENKGKITLSFTELYSLKDVLSNPQEYLGPHSNQLLQFWNKLDTLNDEQWRKIESRFKTIQDTSYIVKTILQIVETLNDKDDCHSLTNCHKLYGSLFTAVYACYIHTGYSLPSAVATFEIIFCKEVNDKIVLKMFDEL